MIVSNVSSWLVMIVKYWNELKKLWFFFEEVLFK